MYGVLKWLRLGMIKNNVNKFFLESDYENATTGLDHYPRIAGAYFAAKLGILEYLTSFKKRKCSVLVFREIRPEYLVPLGVWQIREGVRDALRTKQNVPILLIIPPLILFQISEKRYFMPAKE